MIALATGQVTIQGGDSAYQHFRRLFNSTPGTKNRLPQFVVECRTLGAFWGYIKKKFDSYAERREFIGDEFEPLLFFLEQPSLNPMDTAVSLVLNRFDPEEIHSAWQKAVERRESDPEGAITMARTLLESVCKHILDDRQIVYDDGIDLPKLYRLVANELELAPDQHTEEIFKRILGGCQSVVEGLAAVRNRLSDAHGKGHRPAKPEDRHAELAVNLAGSMATFLVRTHQEQKVV